MGASRPLTPRCYTRAYTPACRVLRRPRRRHSWSAPDSPGLPSWADDFTFLQVADTPSDLCHKVTGATQLIVSHASSFGMELTFAVDKTACLLTSNCPRIIPGHTVADKEGRSCLQVVDEVADQAHLMPLVDSYPHLGCIAVANANPQPEIRYRYAQALSVLNPLRRQPFAASDIPLPLRRTFMRSLVVSRFAYASATTVLSAATGACGIACMSSCGGASFAGLIWRRSFTAFGYYRSLRRLLPCSGASLLSLQDLGGRTGHLAPPSARALASCSLQILVGPATV